MRLIYLLIAGLRYRPLQGHACTVVWLGRAKRDEETHMGEDARHSQIMMVCPYGLFRHALARLIEDMSRFTVLQAASVREAGQVFAAHDDIGIIMMCACDSDPEEQELITRICEENPGTSIVLLAAKFDAGRLIDCLNGGVDGYLVADMSPEALLHSLELVRHGERVFPSQLAAELACGNMSTAPVSETEANGVLTPREQEIVACLVRGDSNKAIANVFSLTEATVKMHLRQVFSKIGAANRTQAAAWAIGNGISVPS